MAYCASLADALSMAPQLGTLAADTKPTSTQAGAIWARAYNEVRLAFRAARLADDPTAGSVAYVYAEQAEMHLTSGYVQLAKGSLSQDARATASDLVAQGKALLAQIPSMREALIAEGAAEEATRTSPYLHSHQVDDADPDFDFAAGTGDRGYSENAVWPEDGDAL